MGEISVIVHGAITTSSDDNSVHMGRDRVNVPVCLQKAKRDESPWCAALPACLDAWT